MNRQTLKRSHWVVTALIVIAIFAVLNFFSYRIFYHWDLTQNKDFSISAASKKTVGNLDDIVNIKVYFSKDLPSSFINLRQEVGDILNEYASYSKGKVKVEFIEPQDDEKTRNDLANLGIPELQFNVLEKDKYQVVNGYLGMVIQYGDKKEVIPVIEDTGNIEYQLTLSIKKVTGQVKARIGFLSGEGAETESDIQTAYQALEKIYPVSQVDLSSAGSVPQDIDTLIIAGPQDKFGDKELKAIDAFLQRGGSVLAMVDGVKVGQGLIAQNNDTGLGKLLDSYGIKLNNDLVEDVYSGRASFSQGYITFSTSYPFWPEITKQGFDQDNPAVAKLESLVLPWVSSLEVDRSKLAGDRVSYLAKTTERAWRQTKDFNLDPEKAFAGGKEGQFDLALSASGRFKSPYGQASAAPGRLIVVGDSDFLRDNFLKQYPDNLLFFQNLVDSLGLDQDLINIRSKGVTERPLREISDKARVAFKYGNILGVTLIVLAFGLSRYFLRRRKSDL